MFSDGGGGGRRVGDGSWELRVSVTDLNEVEPRVLRVKGELHIGGVMLQLVEELGLQLDWSDHALWWPSNNKWLTRTRFTLDQYGVSADALLWFTPVHKVLRVQLPDRRVLNARVDFSVPVFSAVAGLARELGIRHPEELSLRHPVTAANLKQNSLPPPTILRSTEPSAAEEMGESDLSVTRHEVDLRTIVRPKGLLERGRLNGGWLDSGLSLFEQRIREKSTLELRFKFYNFYDLSPTLDAVRIHQLYEQARWQILAEEIDTTEEEGLLFASLQLQVHLQSFIPQQPAPSSTTCSDSDIDLLLNDLQASLEGAPSTTSNLLNSPTLTAVLRVNRPKKYTLKAWRKYTVTCRDLYMSFQKSPTDPESAFSISLKGCEVTPDLNLAQGKYGIRLEVGAGEEGGLSEIWLRCENESEYSHWMAACRLGSKGRTLADSTYDAEVESIATFLAMQRRSATPAINPNSLDIKPEEYVSPRIGKRLRGKLTQRILESHANVKDCNLLEAKLNYIKAWQSLPDYGLSLFIVRFTGQRRDELLGVGFNRIMRMDLATGEHIKTWRYNAMKAWNVNWEVKLMMIQLDDENISFQCLSADCKVVHEFIGGYIFLSLRAKDGSQTLDEELFHKLTGGWS